MAYRHPEAKPKDLDERTSYLVFLSFKIYSICMKKSAKYFMLALSVLCLSAAGYIFFGDQTIFVLKNTEVVVEGNTWHADVLELHKKRGLVRFLSHQGKNLWQVPLAKIEAELLALPETESVTIERQWPDTVRMHVRLKPIILVYFDGKKTVLPITADAAILSAIPFVKAPDVPLITQKNLLRQPETLRALIAQFLAIPQEGLISKLEIAEVGWEDGKGLLVEMGDGEDGQILLGSQDVSAKCRRVANVLKYLESQNQKWRVIDASFAKKVLVRLRKHS